MAPTSKTAGSDKDVKAQGKGVSKDAPKRPMSAYLIWMNEARLKFKEQNPSAKWSMKETAKQWKQLKDRTKWEKLAVDGKAQYEKDMEDFEKTQESD